jgi:peptidase YpeB-like protein
MSQLRIAIVISWFAAFGLAAAPASAHTGAGQPHSKGTLASEARVSMKTARATALARVPHGRVQSAELERERGKLIYSFDIRVPGKSGIEEVQVDAIKGRIVSVVHEGPKAEQKEARQEKLEHGK